MTLNHTESCTEKSKLMRILTARSTAKNLWPCGCSAVDAWRDQRKEERKRIYGWARSGWARAPEARVQGTLRLDWRPSRGARCGYSTRHAPPTGSHAQPPELLRLTGGPWGARARGARCCALNGHPPARRRRAPWAPARAHQLRAGEDDCLLGYPHPPDQVPSGT